MTNIPLKLAIMNIMDKCDEKTRHTNISRQQFLNIINFCLIDNNYFNFNKKINTFAYYTTNGFVPPARLASFKKPFGFTGIYYFRPLHATVGKRWVVLFTCLTYLNCL